RWVTAPEHAREVSGLPAGFRAAGVAAGVKPSGSTDLGLLVSDSPETTSAARFTRSGVLAAPVLLTQERCELTSLRAVVANSGNANAATGNRGLDDAAKMQGAAAIAAGVDTRQVAVASTGVIGVHLPVDRIVGGLRDAAADLRPDGDEALAEAIRSTDAFAKRVSLELEVGEGTVRLAAQAKGAGMIAPNFATLLCFVETDAQLDADTADLLLGATCARSFERISVDGQLSTNDTVIMLASGNSGIRVAPESDSEIAFGEALDAVMRQLALLVVRDGEGAERIGRVVVRGGGQPQIEAAAHAVANSPLVKAALNGGDPNWGRIAQAVGMALPGTAPLPLDISIEDVQVCSGGSAIPFDEQALAERVQRDEVEYEVGLPGEGASCELFFSDLSHGYVTINADYTT
ncbi:MAG TPA: bifunctional glutamate N-acetyltransferase/amino-acid acetyltransferase ArgJ, partial [Solirubrobacteraceae bacterium]|nr:bifunctional glutamate N-acetyltransferase/amino-acid acetyltransferase ArgJ [Solirubrobacteraceae bacterium]